MPAMQRPSLLRSKLFWVGILYFAEGLPLGIFYDVFPVWFRLEGIELKQIGVLSLLGLAWTLKFLWAPAIDAFRHHRWWMAAADLLMGGVMLAFAIANGFHPLVWIAIGVFTVLSATNDIAIDGYTIEYLNKDELGLANGIRIGLYRVGMLVAGAVLIAADYLGWRWAFVLTAVSFAVLAVLCLLAPRERAAMPEHRLSWREEWRGILSSPFASGLVVFLALGTLWLVDQALKWSQRVDSFWPIALASAAAVWLLLVLIGSRARSAAPQVKDLREGAMFGALIELMSRPYIAPVLLFILIFKLPDSAMGFYVKPFWVDAGFTPKEIGLVSVQIGLILSILGGLVGGWITDRIGIFKSLWILGLFQAFSNLGYWLAAMWIPTLGPGGSPTFDQQVLMYSASAIESFTQGLGTAAFLAFLMAIVHKEKAATEYALLSSVFALSRSVAGWAGGYGAQEMGYANYFLLTFFLAFPAYFLLPWIKRTLSGNER